MIRIDSKLHDYLTAAGVQWRPLAPAATLDAEQRWRSIYADAFTGRSRAKKGTKAIHEFRNEPCSEYLIVPFSSGVNGLPIHVLRRQLNAYTCEGPLVELTQFCNVDCS